MPVVLVVDDEADSLRALVRELESRYGAHYRIVACASAEDAVAVLTDLRAGGADVPLILADQWMPGTTGVELLGRARELHPTARRGLLVSPGDRSAAAAIVAGTALGQIEFSLPKPAWSPDEEFHLALTASLGEWWRQRGGRYEAVTVVGAEHHARSHEVRDLLTRNGVPFGFHRSDSAEGLAVLRRLGLPADSGPVVALFTGTVLVDPSNAQVGQALGADVRPPERTYDVLIVGAGPAGLAAAVYATSEGLHTAVLEGEAFGGQAGTSSLIRNYPGFPWGVSGVELTWRTFRQAATFGTQFVYGNPATSMAGGGSSYVLGLQDGSEVTGRVVIIASGASYRRLGVPELEALVGAGVFYGAATVQAQAMTGGHAVVVGGGNSAGQAALHLSRYARQVSVLVRSRSLAESMSDYLVQQIDATSTVDVRYGVEVVGGGGDGRLEYLRLRDRLSGDVESMPAAGLFVLIGAEPFTEWLPDRLGRDRWGYLLTGPDARGSWPLERAPLPLETTVPGVFAVGDVRHGSVKRVASAVGEGSMCVHQVHQYLALPPAPG